MAASMTHASRMGTNDTSGSAATQEFDFNRCTVQKTATHIDPPGIRGGRSHDAEGVVDGTYTVGGAIALNPRPDDLDEWLPRIAGGTKAVDIIALAETLPDWGTGRREGRRRVPIRRNESQHRDVPFVARRASPGT